MHTYKTLWSDLGIVYFGQPHGDNDELQHRNSAKRTVHSNEGAQTPAPGLPLACHLTTWSLYLLTNNFRGIFQTL